MAESDKKSQDGCVIKRGGKCITHACMGVKYVTTENKWGVKKDGTYGWKYLKKTMYKCQKEGVPVSNRSNSVERTRSSLGVENNTILQGATSGIIGVG